MPEHDPEQELGPKFTSALRDQAGATELQGSRLASVARQRVRRRRQAVMSTAAAVLVVVAIGGVWNLMPRSSSENATAGDSSGKSVSGGGAVRTPESVATQPLVPPGDCPVDHPIKNVEEANAVPDGLDVSVPVTGLQACRYQVPSGALLGQQAFDGAVAQQVVDAIKVLPERNADLPVFKCAPQTARPSEAIVLRFTTAAGLREIWVEYTGCNTPGFFTGTHTYGLFAAPLKLFMTGSVRPEGSTYLDALKDW